MFNLSAVNKASFKSMLVKAVTEQIFRYHFSLSSRITNIRQSLLHHI